MGSLLATLAMVYPPPTAVLLGQRSPPGACSAPPSRRGSVFRRLGGRRAVVHLSCVSSRPTAPTSPRWPCTASTRTATPWSGRSTACSVGLLSGTFDAAETEVLLHRIWDAFCRTWSRHRRLIRSKQGSSKRITISTIAAPTFGFDETYGGDGVLVPGCSLGLRGLPEEGLDTEPG